MNVGIVNALHAFGDRPGLVVPSKGRRFFSRAIQIFREAYFSRRRSMHKGGWGTYVHVLLSMAKRSSSRTLGHRRARLSQKQKVCVECHRGQ